MKKILSKKALAMSVLCAVASVGFVVSASAEEKPSYAMDGVTVTDARSYDAKVIRTGGDVTVVTAEEIENHHYTDVLDAIKRIPGVDVQRAGYKSFEYDYGDYQDEVSINGDRRVVILVDGKRMVNEANSSANNHYSKQQVFNLVGVQNIERIEVVKGASAMAYGTDATGGVINIITKKGERSATSLEAGFGSWGKQKYAVSNSGKKDKVSWIVSYDKDKRHDTHYKDYQYGKNRTYKNTGYDEDGTFVKLSYEFDKNNSLDISHSFKKTFAYYPIMAPDYSSLPALQEAIATGSFNAKTNGYTKLPRTDPAWNRYHRWWYVFNEGSFTKNRSSNIDVKYNFKADDGIENYVQVYNNTNKYYMDRNRPKFTNFTQLDYKQISNAKENTKGVNVRWGKKLGENNTLYSGVDFAKSYLNQHSYASYYPDTKVYKHGTYNNVKRDTVTAFVQDKIQLKKLTVTPGLRYNHYGKTEGSRISNKDVYTNLATDQFNKVTMGLFTNYELSKDSNIYASWSQIYNAPYATHIASAKQKLDAEEGNAYTLGYSGVAGKSTFGVNLAYTDMKNTFGQYSALKDGSTTEYEKRVTNMASSVKSIGVNYGYKFNDRWSLNTGYSHAKTKIDKNSGTRLDAANTNSTDELRNNLHYNNRYTASVNYDVKKWNAGLDTTYYTGMDTNYFSDKNFFIMDFHLNYKINDKCSAYLLVNNITNEAYETRAVAVEGIGALPMEGRNFMVGMKYTF